MAMPLSILMLAALTLTPMAQGTELSFGFVQIWSSGAMSLILPLSITFFAVSVFSALILLDKRENTFCVPFERAGSILAGVAASFVLAWAFAKPPPTTPELIGSVLLIAAVFLLALAPRWDARKRAGAAVGEAA